ncbi:unnamed protein product [Protopolystoma xenopodis]|uniref:Uncharacterized protein n=1 Tax=Protopolystoma xenopodis TaxID=117903 RepID=A0A448WCB5_9PLAT|nr:unnamed protein product [Protopolystoma xenopodis]
MQIPQASTSKLIERFHDHGQSLWPNETAEPITLLGAVPVTPSARGRQQVDLGSVVASNSLGPNEASLSSLVEPTLLLANTSRLSNLSEGQDKGAENGKSKDTDSEIAQNLKDAKTTMEFAATSAGDSESRPGHLVDVEGDPERETDFIGPRIELEGGPVAEHIEALVVAEIKSISGSRRRKATTPVT